MKGDLWERGKVAAAVALALGTLGGSAWLASLIAAPVNPQRRGFAVEGIPPVDLASAQRAWPRGEGRPGDREILLGYVRNIEQARVPVAAGAAAAAPAAALDLGSLLAAADPERGERTAQVCASCHTFGAGEPNRLGPNLHAVVGRPVASAPGFSYSAALSKAGGRWTYEALDRFLTSPARAVAGTRMSFAGLRNPRDRAHVIAFLARISPGAPPFPKPTAEAPGEAGEQAAPARPAPANPAAGTDPPTNR